MIKGIFSKLTTMARGAARESAEVLLDANAIRIFEQKIVDVEESIQLRSQAMSEVIVARNQINREIEAIKAIITKREDQARTLIDEKSDDDLSNEIAADIAQYEHSLDDLQAQYKAMTKRIQTMESALRRALTEIVQYHRDLRLARARQISSSSLAKANNIPKQLGELEDTRRYISALQTGDDDQESAWTEMEGRMDPQGLNQRHSKISETEQAKKKEAVLSRLNQTVRA
jgi:phage shock protein A